MQMNVGREIAVMQGMTVGELRDRYSDTFGEQTRSHNKEHLLKRLIWRVQELAEGTLSERARRRAEELANDADIRMKAPHNVAPPATGPATRITFQASQDDRLPLPGAVLAREYKGKTIVVTVLPKGFEYEGQVYRSLSAVAEAVTGTHWNGYHFFNILKGGKRNG